MVAVGAVSPIASAPLEHGPYRTDGAGRQFSMPYGGMVPEYHDFDFTDTFLNGAAARAPRFDIFEASTTRGPRW